MVTFQVKMFSEVMTCFQGLQYLVTETEMKGWRDASEHLVRSLLLDFLCVLKALK